MVGIKMIESNLLCPGCGSTYLHQQRVDAWWRKEDSEFGLHVTSDIMEQSVAGTGMQGNPSPRRQGVTIQFFCEECDVKPVLCIIQHKGETFMEWVP